jgi:hypothetical protein
MEFFPRNSQQNTIQEHHEDDSDCEFLSLPVRASNPQVFDTRFNCELSAGVHGFGHEIDEI